MKKLLSVFAAAAVLFGFASCSGDLHDDSIKPLYIEGAMSTTRTAITMIDDTTQEYEFTYESGMSKEWGSPAAGVAFKFIKSAAAWTDDFGGKQDEPIYLNINDDFVTLEARSGSNSNPGNVVIDNLTPGEKYKLIVDYDAANKIVKVKVTGAAIDFPNLELIDEDGTKYPLTRSGSTYSYVWTPAEAGSVSFYATNGYLYYGADGKVNSTKPGSANLITVDYEADKEYFVQILTDFGNTSDVIIDARENIDNPLNGFDGVFALFGDVNTWSGGDTGIRLKILDTKSVYFEYSNTSSNEYAFVAVKKGSDWKVRYEADGTTTKIYNLGDKIPTAEKDLGNSGRAVIPIEPYHTYGVTATIDDDGKVSISVEDKGKIKVKLQEAAQLQGSIGNFDLEWKDGVAVVETTLKADYTDSWYNKNPNTISFALLTVKDDWNNSPCYKSTTMLVGDETALKIDTATNNKVVSIEPLAGKKVKLTFTGTETTINCKAEIVE